MSEVAASKASGAPPWRAPVLAFVLLCLDIVLLAFTGLMPLLFVPVFVGAWSAMNLKTTKWHWLPLAPCLLAVLYWLYLFIAILLGYLLG